MSKHFSSVVKNILIIRPDAIGDCVLITPALTALKQHWPQAQITVLAQPLTRDLFAPHPAVANVLTDLREIKANYYDLSIHFYNELPYALAAARARIPYRLGDRSKPLVSWLYNLKASQNWRDILKHDVEQNMLLLEPLGINPPYPKLSLGVDKEALQKVIELLKTKGLAPGDKIAGLHLSTGRGNKAWSPRNFGSVADYLTGQGFKVVATGLEKDDVLIKQAGTTAIINLTRIINLKELIALTSLYQLFVGVDTGPFHLAAALGIPIVHISTSKFSLPLRWGPWQDRHVLVRKKSRCSLVCTPASCQANICAEEITPEEVIKACQTLLSGGGNKTQSEAFSDWCRKSLNILIAYQPKNEQRAQELLKMIKQAGFNAILANSQDRPDYQKLFRENNINIVHAVDPSLVIRWQALTSSRSLIIPALYLRDDQRLKSFSELFQYYQKCFATSRV